MKLEGLHVVPGGYARAEGAATVYAIIIEPREGTINMAQAIIALVEALDSRYLRPDEE